MVLGRRLLLRSLLVLALAAAVLAAAAAVVLAWDAAPPLSAGTAPVPASAALLERGRVLALAGNCAGCHTARGGQPYAGGRALATPFGSVFAGNLTPDPATGLGRWTPEHFWRALQHGRGADGRRLVPAFPYTETTRMPREDSDALFAWLQTLPAVQQPNPDHALRWPFGTPLALAAWRLLFFRPGVWVDDPQQTAQWNRGAYLVNGPAHCVACHGGRNALGATASAGFGGGLMPRRNWYAPALTRADEASVADWPLPEIVQWLREGRAPRGQATGPMAEVVVRSTQHLPQEDLLAMAVYLKSLPVQPATPAPRFTPAAPERLQQGQRLYAQHCADCHGQTGAGGVLAEGPRAGQRVVPPLAGNRLLVMNPSANLVRAIALGGFGAVTTAHPQPFGMPPFAHVLSDAQIADVVTWLRHNEAVPAPPLSALEVARWRSGHDD
jgi:mono/diheme cytochrome c family protein